MEIHPDRAVVIGGGVGGLSAAIRLAAAGMPVTVLEQAARPGGKLRALASPAGPVDAGPTVLTLRGEFDALFALAGTRMEDHLNLVAQPLLARHHWPDGTRLDLFADAGASAEAIHAAFGARAAREFRRFDATAQALLAAFEMPVMRSERPRLGSAAAAALIRPRCWPYLLPGRSLAAALAGQFTDTRLRQLFGRYSTYVGGIPAASPAVLALVWRAEAAGVWGVDGGLHRLAGALSGLLERLGGTLRCNTAVRRIEVEHGRVRGVVLANGDRIATGCVVFNGDPAALRAGLLGAPARRAVTGRATYPRSLSARVWCFAARPSGQELALHNLFFADSEDIEFGPIARGQVPAMPTIYACAQDRAAGLPAGSGPERFQLILNAPAPAGDSPTLHTDEETRRCLDQTFSRLARFGLTFDPVPDCTALTRPADLARLFPGSGGAIYGRSPHGMLAPLWRSRARTAIAGLYLAGGGVHPGPGLPMAAMSGHNAARAVLADRTSRSMWRRTAMPGGTSTQSATTGAAPSR